MADLETTTGDPTTAGNGGGGSAPARVANDAGGDVLDELLAAGKRRRRWPWLVAGLAVGIGASVVVASYLGDGDEAADARTESVELTTAVVETRDLVEHVEYAAELSYGEPVPVLAGADGTVTSIAAVGDTVLRGDVLAAVDGEPVVAFLAPSPFWRDLENGDEGDDVLALEANLVALGFDADGDLTVDGDYTAATAEAVEDWETDLGLEPTGDVPLGRVVALDGDAVVVDRPDVGTATRAGQSLATVQVERNVADVVQAGDGEVTALVAEGEAVAHGDVVWQLDGVDVTAIVEPDEVTGIVLDVMGDDDVERLEETLVFFGFDPDGAITIDDEGDLATVAAVTRWQESIGLAPTGITGAQYYVSLAADQTVVATHLADGDVLEEAALVLSLGGPTLTATAAVAADEIADFAVGDALTVELVDESVVDAVVVDIADVADPAATPDAPPTIDVTIELTGDPSDAAIVTGPVTALIEASRIDDAVAVPTRALVSLREGGFAVEVRDPSGAVRLVGVELGAFDDGVVEIVGGDVEPGDEIVVPS